MDREQLVGYGSVTQSLSGQRTASGQVTGYQGQVTDAQWTENSYLDWALVTQLLGGLSLRTGSRSGFCGL